jgi:hypothetical protein
MFSIPKPKIPNLKKVIKNEQFSEKPKFGMWTMDEQIEFKKKDKK